MHKFLLYLIASTLITKGYGQINNQADYTIEQGLQFRFNNGAYNFKIGGFIQPSYRFEQGDSFMGLEGNTPKHFFNSKRTYFQLGGNAVEEKVSFFVQTNFSERQPLLDAWIAYHPNKDIRLTFGQKQTFTNNREMLFREDRLNFTDRGLISERLSASGREFGLFLEGKFGSRFGIAPQIAITSGDGRNSFGSDSRDNDLGGLKYGARLDVYPLGFFSVGNDLYSADLMHESKLKILIGAAYSINYGASHSVGEGHGSFLLYNANGELQLPNYKKLYGDILAKYKGFSVLIEWGDGFASGLSENYAMANATQLLVPKQISNYLVLGSVINGQLGYVTRSGYGFDLRYGKSTGEFENYSNNILKNTKSYSLGFSKYFVGNNLKLQATYNRLNSEKNGSLSNAEILIQFAF